MSSLALSLVQLIAIAVAAALLYANKRKERKANSPDKPGVIPSGEAPETD